MDLKICGGNIKRRWKPNFCADFSQAPARVGIFQLKYEKSQPEIFSIHPLSTNEVEREFDIATIEIKGYALETVHPVSEVVSAELDCPDDDGAPFWTCLPAVSLEGHGY